jgi:hypothetical protein
MRHTCFVVLAFSLLAIAHSQTGTGNSPASTSDPQALALSTAAMTALAGSGSVSDVTLTGTATENAGSTVNSGPATFEALGSGNSRLSLTGSGKQEIRSLDDTGSPAGAWVTPDGVSHSSAAHNTWSDAAWFFPALTAISTTAKPGVIAKYIGRESRNGATVEHLRFWRTGDTSHAGVANLIPRLSTMDVYLDAATMLPQALTFKAHTDNDLNTDIPVEVRYSNYQPVNGLMVPFHVEKLLAGGVVLDFEVTQVSVNSGLNSAQFNLP